MDSIGDFIRRRIAIQSMAKEAPPRDKEVANIVEFKRKHALRRLYERLGINLENTAAIRDIERRIHSGDSRLIRQLPRTEWHLVRIESRLARAIYDLEYQCITTFYDDKLVLRRDR